MLKVTVDRTRWLRGGNGTLLERGTGKMCCLGFVCKQVGLEDSTIQNQADPQELYQSSMDFEDGEETENEKTDFLRKKLGAEVKLLRYSSNTEVCERLISTNDMANIDDSERERMLIELAEEAGIEFSFIN